MAGWLRAVVFETIETHQSCSNSLSVEGCTQLLHALNHFLEVGVEKSHLPSVAGV